MGVTVHPAREPPEPTRWHYDQRAGPLQVKSSVRQSLMTSERINLMRTKREVPLETYPNLDCVWSGQCREGKTPKREAETLLLDRPEGTS